MIKCIYRNKYKLVVQCYTSQKNSYTNFHSKEATFIPPCLHLEHSWIAGRLLVILYEEVQQSELSQDCLLRGTCCYIHVHQDERYQLLSRSSAMQCPLPLWMTCTNSDGSMSKFIVKPQHTLCRPESAEYLVSLLSWFLSIHLDTSSPSDRCTLVQ